MSILRETGGRVEWRKLGIIARTATTMGRRQHSRSSAGKTAAVAMREECKHFQSRTYASGEVARFCELDLAPEAPWRCPADCAAYERRFADAGWVHGSLLEPAVEEEPDVPGAVDLLGQAEGIVNAAAPEALAAVRTERQRAAASWWKRLRRRR